MAPSCPVSPAGNDRGGGERVGPQFAASPTTTQMTAITRATAPSASQTDGVGAMDW